MRVQPRSPTARWVEVAIAAALSSSLFCYLSWVFAPELQRVVLPRLGMGTMMPLTALGLVAASVALLLLRRSGRVRAPAAGRKISYAVLLLGALLTAGHLIDGFGPFDHLLVPVRASELPVAGRTAVTSALALIASAVALLLLDARHGRWTRASQILSMAVWFIALQAVVGYLFAERVVTAQEADMDSLRHFSPMSLSTALGFLFLSTGTFFARPSLGVASLLVARGAAGQLLRRLLALAIAIPAALSFVRLEGERSGLLDPIFGASFFAVILSAAFVATTFPAVRQLLDASEALRQSERRFRTAFDEAPIGMTLVGLDFRFLRVNHVFCELVGYSAEQLRAMTFDDITVPEDLAVGRAFVKDILASAGGSAQLEKRYRRRDGRIVPVIVTSSLVRSVDGVPLHFIAHVEDIGARRRWERDQQFLVRAGAELAAALDPESTLRTAIQLLVPERAEMALAAYLDERAENGELVAFDAADVVRREAIQALVANGLVRRGLLHGVLAEVVQTGKPSLVNEVTPEFLLEQVETPAQTELLERLHLSSVLALPITAQGMVVGVIALGRSRASPHFDDQDLFVAEKLLQVVALAVDNGRLFQSSEQATRVRDEVLRIVAHDLRNPLSTVRIAAQVISRNFDEPGPTVQRAMRSIQTASRTAERLIEDLLDAARMQQGHLIIEPTAEMPAALLALAKEQHQDLAAARGQTLQVRVARRIPLVRADRHRILQVLGNLIGNALKFSPPGGRVDLSVSGAGEEVRFEVSDEGPGMAREDLPHVFDPFWQGGPAKKEGAGLGLAIARGIVESHGGTITVESTVGVGTTFAFTLPAATAGDVFQAQTH